MPNAAPDKPWAYITADFIVKLPLVRGYGSILVVYDWLTKMAHTSYLQQRKCWWRD